MCILGLKICYVLVLRTVPTNTEVFLCGLQYNTGEISHFPRGFSGLIYNIVWGTLAILLVTQFTINKEVKGKMPPFRTRPNHNTPYSFRTVSGFFNVPHYTLFYFQQGL